MLVSWSCRIYPRINSPPLVQAGFKGRNITELTVRLLPSVDSDGRVDPMDTSSYSSCWPQSLEKEAVLRRSSFPRLLTQTTCADPGGLLTVPRAAPGKVARGRHQHGPYGLLTSSSNPQYHPHLAHSSDCSRDFLMR